MAVFICSKATHTEAREALNNATEADFAAWGETCDVKKLDDEVKAFVDYIEYYRATPLRNDSETQYARAPWPWLYAWILMRDNVVKTQEQAWNTICSDAFAWNACRCAFDNDKNLMDELEVDFYLSE